MFSLSRWFFGLGVVVSSLLSVSTASAGPISFNFGASFLENGHSKTLTTSSTSTDIATLLSDQAGFKVSVSGTVQVNTNYDGDGHVVGPTIGGTVVPWTLGDLGSGSTSTNPKPPTTSNPTYTPYLASTSSFTLTFAQPVYAVSFDYEIYPDATPAVPTFEFTADDSKGKSIASFTATSIAPGAKDPYLPSDPTTSTHSPNSGPNGTETSNQLIGTATFVFSASDPATSLTFADWPQEIGINDLTIYTTTTNLPNPFTGVTAPAPSSAILLGLGALGMAGFMTSFRRRQIATV